MLTKIEEQVLLTVWNLQGEGYGVNIFQSLENLNDKKLTMGVIYDVLERLTKQGLVKTRMGETTKARGGMRKKFYQISGLGIKKLVEARKVYSNLTHNFDKLLEQFNNN